MDRVVRDCVVGRPVAARDRRRATIEGFRRVYRRGASYPVLLPQADGVVEGLLVDGLSKREVARLIAFEGEEYRLVLHPVRPRQGRRVAAWVFLPGPGVAGTDQPWRFDPWRRRFAHRYRQRVRAHHGPA